MHNRSVFRMGLNQILRDDQMSTATKSSTIIAGAQRKLRNRRVGCALMADGTLVFRFKRLVGRDFSTTSLRVTLKAFAAMIECAEDIMDAVIPEELK